MPHTDGANPDDHQCLQKGSLFSNILPTTASFWNDAAHFPRSGSRSSRARTTEESHIDTVIIDPGTNIFEGLNPGLLYMAASRATTMGSEDDPRPKDSAIYTGQG